MGKVKVVSVNDDTSVKKPMKRNLNDKEVVQKKLKILTAIEAPKEENTIIEPINEPNCFLIIKNLVRPFTIKQLLTHLNTVVDDCKIIEEEFWVNDIKSFCYVKYENIEKSKIILEKMNGSKWPLTNPKFLHVDYANENTMYIDTKGKLGVEDPHQTNTEIDISSKECMDVLSNFNQDSSNGDDNNEQINVSSMDKIENNADKKILDVDSLFHKTTTLPVIYWMSCKNTNTNKDSIDENNVSKNFSGLDTKENNSRDETDYNNDENIISTNNIDDDDSNQLITANK